VTWRWWLGLAQLDKILKHNQILFERQEMTMAAIDNLNANLVKLKADVEALLANQSQTTEAQIQAAADAVAALDAEVQPQPIG
jgi:hypothetical protein